MSRQEGGYFLVTTVIITLLLTAVGLSIASLTSVQYQHVKRSVYTENAQLLAEASIEQSVQELNADESFAGYTTEQQFFDNGSQGRGVFTSTVTDNPDGETKRIVAEGKVWRLLGLERPGRPHIGRQFYHY
jgi:hypothetical protein